jgi:cell division protein FtsB
MIPGPAPAPTFYDDVRDFLAKFQYLLLALTVICVFFAVLYRVDAVHRRELAALGNAIDALAESVNSTKIQVNNLREQIALRLRPFLRELASERDALVDARDGYKARPDGREARETPRPQDL